MIRMGKQRKIWGQICAIFVVAFCALYGVAYGEAILNVDSATGQANLEKFRSPVAAERSNISFQFPFPF